MHSSPLLQFACSSAHDFGAGFEAVVRLSLAVLLRLYQNYFDESEVSRLKASIVTDLKPFTLRNYYFFLIKNMKNIQRMVPSVNVHNEAIVLCIVPACNGFTVGCKRFDRIPKSWYVFRSTACSTVNVHYAHGRR